MRRTILFLVLCLLLPQSIFAAHWAENSLAWAQREGLIQGDEHQDIAPDRLMTRAEFYVFLDRFLPDCPTLPLPKADIALWARESLARHLTRDILSPAALASLESPMSREEAAVAIAKSYHLAPSSAHLAFADGKEITDSRVGSLVEKNILRGYPDKTLRPHETLTRAACVSLLHRSLLTLGTAPAVQSTTPSLPFSGLLAIVKDPTFPSRESRPTLPEVTPPEDKTPTPPEDKNPADPEDKEPVIDKAPTPETPPYSVTVTGGTANPTSAKEGDTVTISATVPVGQVFSHWEGNGVSFADDKQETTTFTMPAHDVAIVAHFEKKSYTINVNGGTADPTSAKEGDTVSISATVPEGFIFDHWEGDGVSFTNDKQETTTFTMPGHDVAISAHFEKKSYSINVNGGTASPTSAKEGDTVTITANVPERHVFNHWEGDGVTFANDKQEKTTFTMPGHDVTVSAVTEKAKPITLYVRFVPTPIETYQGASVSIKAPDIPNHIFHHWTLLIGTSMPVTFEDISAQETTLHIPKDYPRSILEVVPAYRFDNKDPFPLHVIGGTPEKTSAKDRETILITANTPEGKVFDHWESEDVSIANPTSWKTNIGPVKKETTLRAVYRDAEEGSFAIHTTGGTHAERRMAKPGETVHLTLPPSRSTVLNEWVVLEKDVTLVRSGNDVSFIMPDHDVTIFPVVHLPESLLKVYEPDGRLRKKSDRYLVGKVVRVDADSSYRSRFKSWVRTPELLVVEEKGGTISFIMPPQTVTLRAELLEP